MFRPRFSEATAIIMMYRRKMRRMMIYNMRGVPSRSKEPIDLNS